MHTMCVSPEMRRGQQSVWEQLKIGKASPYNKFHGTSSLADTNSMQLALFWKMLPRVCF